MRGVQGKQLTSGTEPPATVLSKKQAVASRSSRRRILAGRARRQQPLLSAQAFYPNWRPRGCKSLHLQCWGRIGSSCAAVPSRSPSESTASSSGLVMASYQRRVVTSHACPPASPAPYAHHPQLNPKPSGNLTPSFALSSYILGRTLPSPLSSFVPANSSPRLPSSTSGPRHPHLRGAKTRTVRHCHGRNAKPPILQIQLPTLGTVVRQSLEGGPLSVKTNPPRTLGIFRSRKELDKTKKKYVAKSNWIAKHIT